MTKRAWRKIKKQVNPNTGQLERYGRRYRDAMRQFQNMKPSGYPLLNGLMALAGLIQLKMPDTITEKDDVIDAEIISEGEHSAA